jgi:dolichol-phosphate mannosyltransferase
MVQLSVVVPTFNEGSHIVEFLRDLEAANAGRDYEILVVDDNSPDGTHAKVAAYARGHPRVVPVLRLKEKGLATAVIEGMRRSRGEYVAVMDSDYQHPPETVPRLLDAALKDGADCVVASRYAAEGTVTGFPLSRRVISWGARTLAVLGLPVVRRFRVRDPMSGFFLVRRDRVPIEELRPRGYKILLEVLARARLERVVEVGFPFQNRRAGESKLRLRTQYDYFLHVLKLAWADRENRRLALFSLVGASGILVNLAVIALLVEGQGWDERLQVEAAGQLFLVGTFLAGVVAREAAVLWNFTWNDRVTFGDKRAGAHAGFFHRMFRFHVVSLGAFLVYLVVFYPLVHFGAHYVLASLVAILLSFFLNYRGNVNWTYERRKNPQDH